MKYLKYFTQFIFVIIFFLIFKLLGPRTSSIVGGKLFEFIGPLFRSKNIIKNNIRIAFPNKNSNEVINYKPFFCKRSKDKIEKYDFHTKKLKIDYVFYYPKYIRLISSYIVDFNIEHKYLTHLSDHKGVYTHFYSL